jgi:hypothetical protein
MFALPDDKTSKIRTHWMDADGSHERGTVRPLRKELAMVSTASKATVSCSSSQ